VRTQRQSIEVLPSADAHPGLPNLNQTLSLVRSEQQYKTLSHAQKESQPKTDFSKRLIKDNEDM
jgi:hypothetical protein